MGADDDLARAGGEAVGDGRRRAALGAMAVEDVAHGADGGELFLDCFGDGAFELGGGDGVEEREQTGGDVAEVAAALGGEAQELFGRGDGAGEAVEAAAAAGAGLEFDQSGDMLWVLDLLSAVP